MEHLAATQHTHDGAVFVTDQLGQVDEDELELWQDDSPVVELPVANPKRGRSSRDCAKPVQLHYLLLGMRYILTTATLTILSAMCS